MMNSFLNLPLLNQSNAQVIVRLFIIGSYSQGFQVLSDGVVCSPLLSEGISQVVVSLCIVGLYLQSLYVLFDGLIGTSFLSEGDA